MLILMKEREEEGRVEEWGSYEEEKEKKCRGMKLRRGKEV